VLTLTTEAVRALAPDASALKSGSTLASPSRWTGLGRDGRALWGACQGSGKDPYQVVVDLAGPASRCSCPSRKFPCKHALGLMLMAASGEKAIPVATLPDTARTWLAGRDARASAAATREASPEKAVADAKARERRVATRERRVDAGLDEFRLWLRDLARRGLAEVAAEGWGSFDAAAARLVDAQAGGVARMLRAAASRAVRSNSREAVGATVDWADDLLETAGRLYLLLETYGRRDTIAPALAEDVRSIVGWSRRETELPEDDVVADRWTVAGRRHVPDDRLLATRTWLYGERSGRWAALLDWEPIRSQPVDEPPVGAALDATLVFYPGAVPLRAALRGDWNPARDGSLDAGLPGTWRAAIVPYAAALATNPWHARHPVAVTGVVPVRSGDDGVLARDTDGDVVPLVFPGDAADAFASFAGGCPVTLFGEWDGRGLTVLAAGDAEAWVPLPGSEDATGAATFTGPPDVEGALPPAPGPWEALRAWALLGTSRAQPDASLQPLLARMADRSAEDQLLGVAAVLAVRRRATAPVVRAPGLDALEEAPPEPLPRASRASGRVLFQLLGSNELVAEWVGLAAAAGLRCPPELLPRLLATPGVDEIDGIDRVLGRRAGRDADPADAPLLREQLDRVDGTRAAEAATVGRLVAALRRTDPDAARTWLADCWTGLTAGARNRALATLEHGLSDADAGLLDDIVAGETNRERRETAATLACRLPSSAVRARIEERARQLVRMKGLVNRSLETVAPTEESVEAMERDGLTFPAYIQHATAGDRTVAIVVWHVARIAPARWSAWLGMTPKDAALAMTGNKLLRYRVAAALNQSTRAHRDSAFAEVLLTVKTDAWVWNGTGLWAIVPLERRQQLIVEHLLADTRPDDWPTMMSLRDALSSTPPPWPDRLIGPIRHDLVRTLASVRGGPGGFAVDRLLAIVGHLPPDALTEAAHLVAERAREVQDATGLDRVSSLIATRQGLHAAFAGPSASR
jgi:Family of unknown function (DUF5691)/SWIM zinc finger